MTSENTSNYSANVTIEFPCPTCRKTVRHSFLGAKNMVPKDAYAWVVDGEYECSNCHFIGTATAGIRDYRTATDQG